jgi:hypothetical protein
MQLEWPTLTPIVELPICLAVMAAMTSVGADSFVRARQHVHVLEALAFMTGPKIAIAEYHAVAGVWPDSNGQAGYFDRSPENKGWLESVTIRPGGAVDFRFSDRVSDLAGKVLTISAWQGSTNAESPIAWACGRAHAASLSAASADHTTLGDDELPSPCVARP